VISTALQTLTVLLCLTVIASDLYARRVPNMLLLAALSGCAACLLIDGLQNHNVPWLHMLGLLSGFMLLPFYACGWMGAGDVKFFATLGFLLGARALLPIWVIGSLLCGAHAALVLMARAPALQMLPGWAAVQGRFHDSAWSRRLAAARGRRQGLPYAACLAIGALLTLALPSLADW